MTSGQEVVSKPQGKAELRRQYLLEKYVWKWKQFMRSRKGEGLFPRLLKLSHNNWLRQVHSLDYLSQACSGLHLPSLVFSSMSLNKASQVNKASDSQGVFVAGPFHTGHAGSQTSSLHHRGGSDYNPQPQAAGPGSAHQVGASNV